MAKRTSGAGAVNAVGEKPQQAIVDADTLRRLYVTILTCRTAAEKLRSAVPDAATAHAAATVELTGDDAVAISRESMALQLPRSTPVAAAFPGKDPSSALSNGAGPKMIARGGAGGSQLNVAAGVALAQKLDEKHAVVVALTDADSMSTGAGYEALNYAAANKLPMVVVVENMNSAPGSLAPNFIAIAQAHAVPGFIVDGNDAVAVYRVAREAINRARNGRGPSLIECRAFEVSEDPLRHLERYLEKHGWWTAEWKRELVARIESELPKKGAA